MAKYVVHEGKKSWWSGKVTTLCGAVFTSGNNEYKRFSSVSCPACKAAKKG
jgi:hypothetical protein